MKDQYKILFLLTNTFTNDSRVLKEGTSLVKAGYEVILACLLGEGLKKQEMINGIDVHRFDFYNNIKDKSNNNECEKTEKKNIKLLQKLYESNFLPIKIIRKTKRIIWNLYYYLKFTLNVFYKFKNNTDIVHCHDLYTLPMGVIFKILTFGRIKIVYDAHEYETEVGYHITGITKYIYEIIEKICIKFANKVICVSDSIGNEYVRLYGIKKPTILFNTPNFQDPKKNADIFRKELSISKEKQIYLYQGGFIPGRNIEILLDAFKNLENTNKVIIFLGFGPLAEVIKDKAKKFSNIYLYPGVSPDILLDYTASADIGFNITDNSCLNHYYCLPNKLFEYSMAKIPTIVSNLYELNKFIKKNKNGIVLKEISSKSIEEAIKKITNRDLAQMKKAASIVREKYHWENEEKKLLKLYKDLKF